MDRLTVLTWNLDHFWSADLPRRATKLASLESLLQAHRPDVVYLQQIGGFGLEGAAFFRQRGFHAYWSAGPNGTAGVLTLLRSALVQLWAPVCTVIIPGHVLLL